MLQGLKKLNAPELEEKVLQFWKENGIFQKSLEGRKGKKQFVFYEGPPTANARPGMHHVVGRVLKDIILRLKTMQGYFVARRAGWDTHGLPVEIEIEKELGLKSKSDIETFGIAVFNARARQSVWKYKEEWEKLSERIGFWLDMEHPYITYENSYIEKLWGVLKKIDERKLLYTGHKVVPWCPRCGTALSSHELAQGYKEIMDTAAYVRFRIHDSRFKNTSILSWTTTLWTLPGNVAVAINPKHSFVRVPDPTEPDHFLIVEKTSAERLGLLSGLRTVNGSYEFQIVKAEELIGVCYEPLFTVRPLASAQSYKVYPADFVSTNEGTGVVHTAVMYGEDDYALGVKIGLPQHHTIDERGMFTTAVPELAGLYSKGTVTEEKILAYLKIKNYVFKIESHTHDYPFCWRCDTPVLYYATNSWFIKMSVLQKQLVAANKKVQWTPAHLKDGRFGEWLIGVKDWAISRARYWGTPLPIWMCACGHYVVVGSVKELGQLGGKAPDDLHRPFIDEAQFPCLQCKGGMMRRVKGVCDVWFDSGAMPFASEEYPDRYPADYICEAIDQTRGWFYTLLAVGILMGEGAPYRNVVCYSHLLDKQGKKMSKSKGNAPNPWDLLQRYGIDVLRWYVYTSAIVKEPIKFDEADVVKSGRGVIPLLYNSFVFLDTYCEQIAGGKWHIATKHILDKWVMARLHQTIKSTTESLEKYEIGDAARALEDFIGDLSRWYIRRSRKRMEALPVLRQVLLETTKLIAPLTPFFAEALYQSLWKLGSRKGKQDTPMLSVHLEDWPKADAALIDKILLTQMKEVRRLASLGLATRVSAGIQVRQPLAALKIKMQNAKIKIKEELLEILKDEVNVKKIIFDEKLDREVVLDTVITPALYTEGLYRALVRMVQGLRREAQYAPQDTAQMFIECGDDIQRVLKEHTARFMSDTHMGEIVFKKNDATDSSAVEDFDGARVWVGVRRI